MSFGRSRCVFILQVRRMKSFFYLYDFLLKNAKQIAFIVFCNTLRRTGGLFSIVALLQYPGYSKG